MQWSDLDRPPVAPPPPRRTRTYPLRWVLIGFVVLAALLFGGPFIFFHVIEGSAPAKLHLPSAAGASSGPVVPGPISGTWTVAGGSQAGYRVHEILFGQSHTAVGRTSKVTGGMVVSGTEVTAADFTVDLSSVKSDQSSRDAQFTGYIMETYNWPHGTFRLTKPIQLGQIPPAGQTVSLPATGNLTLRGVTKPITFTLSAERLAGTIDVNAEIPIKFGEWHIPRPNFAVARVGDTGTIEVLLHLVPARSDSAAK